MPHDGDLHCTASHCNISFYCSKGLRDNEEVRSIISQPITLQNADSKYYDLLTGIEYRTSNFPIQPCGIRLSLHVPVDR